MIAVIDYGVGNVKSVVCALRRLGEEAVLTSDHSEIESAAGVVLPGVGAFSAAMENLRGAGLDDVVRRLAEDGKPLLGICVGVQLFFSESEEHGIHEGLGLLRGCVRRFPSGLKVPHMGWNEVLRQNASPLLEGIADGAFFYFAHSYYVEPEEPDVIVGLTDYGVPFASAVGRRRLLGVQFHPEKSGPAGAAMLANFCRLCEQT